MGTADAGGEADPAGLTLVHPADQGCIAAFGHAADELENIFSPILVADDDALAFVGQIERVKTNHLAGGADRTP